MKGIVDQILQWPLIVQGALGSALFWAILTLGERATRKIGIRMRGFSRTRRLESLRADAIRCEAMAKDDPQDAALAFLVLLYGAIHYLIKALAALCLGLIFDSLFPVFGVVGFMMALYYLFLAASAVRDLDKSKTGKAELERIRAEIKKLESEA